MMLRKSDKIKICGGTLITFGILGLFIIAFTYLVQRGNVPPPTSSVEGIVISYTPSYTTGTDSHISATCVVHYKVGDQTYNIVGSSCSGSGERVEVIYSLENPSKGAISRRGFYTFMMILSLLLIIFGYLLIRKSRRIRELGGDYDLISEEDESDPF
jgi:hypothetical protein